MRVIPRLWRIQLLRLKTEAESLSQKRLLLETAVGGAVVALVNRAAVWIAVRARAAIDAVLIDRLVFMFMDGALAT